MNGLFFAIAFLACAIGKICGMGGGVIIKPVMDATGLLPLSTINFCSACTVAAMACWSVGKSFLTQEAKISAKTSTALAIGSAIGGVIGKAAFSTMLSGFGDDRLSDAIQAVLLIVATLLTLLYTLRKDKISSMHITSLTSCAGIGLFLGALGAFLGIGGGPFNMAVLYYFFSMATKTAAINSLYIILFSQLTAIGSTVLRGQIPDVDGVLLLGMALAGLLGSEVGGALNRHLSEKEATRLFETAILLVIGISLYNLYHCLR